MAAQWDYRGSRRQSMGRQSESQAYNSQPGSFTGRFDRSFSRQSNPRDSYSRNYDNDFYTNSYEDMDDNPPVTWTYVEWWVIPGPYSGVGPRNYHRSDDRICEDVCERLSRHGQLDAREIEVDVNQGEVTLQGMVDSRRAKRLAEDIAENVPGVRDVHNRLHLQRNEQAQTRSPNRPMGTDRFTDRNLSEDSGILGTEILPGMEVVGSDGKRVGNVKQIRQNDVLIDRTLARDVYVPLSAFQSTEGKMVLNIPADEVDRQGWKSPELFHKPEIDNK